MRGVCRLRGAVARRLGAALLLLAATPGTALAHGLAVYASTPVTPPVELLWWAPVSVFLLLGGAFLILWKLCRRPWRRALLLAPCVVLLSMAAFVLLGGFASHLSTAPPPGLGFPHPALWGMGWSDAGFLFVQWNLGGFGIFLVTLLVFAGLSRKPRLWVRVIPAVLGLYLLGLSPYLATGALAHGWAGGYVRMECDQRLAALNGSLFDYATDHGGLLPEAEGLDDLLEVLEPYVHERYLRRSKPLDVCPEEEVFEREPRRYVWDGSFGGRSCLGLDPAVLEEGPLPVSCPRHGRPGGFLRGTVGESLEEARQAGESR